MKCSHEIIFKPKPVTQKKIEEAAKRVADKIKGMSESEFQKRMDECRDEQWYSEFLSDTNWEDTKK